MITLRFKNTFLFYAIILFLALSGCGSSITSVSNPPTQTKLISTTLASTSGSSLVMEYLDLTLSTDCQDYNYCLTPDNISGKICYSGIMVGDESGYSLGPIIGDIIDPSQITSFPQGDLLDFNFSTQVALDGSMTCCDGSPYPDDADAIATRIESYFGYTDTTFTLSASDGVDNTLVGTHTIRTVYGDIDNTSYTKGDLLYSSDNSTFYWCTVANGCTHSTRPASPVQYADVVNFSGTPDGLGNQTIPTFAVTLDQGSQVTLTETEVKNNSWVFTVDFSMENGVVFTSDPTQVTTIVGLVQIFQLAAEPGDQSNGFSASLTVTATPL